LAIWGSGYKELYAILDKPLLKTETMLGEHLSKRKDKKKLAVILAITLWVLLTGILLMIESL
jgi:hypothetical protein